ncbi:hypothetical protein L5515_003184 [Caenorhabditis briggsae]|uniref:ZP domain-containing protein n=1 Tax=Caenorhabditis briggsae TaxID=6238 RepID=A0AAE9JAH4_CAEBR|nr:hypothetical protein L5515_003184 [Caenorhabditis briggsae]
MFIFPSSSSFSLQNSLLYLTVFFLCSGNISEAKTFENRIVGKSFVSCRPEGVSLVAKTEDFFEGQIYIKGARNNPTCSKSFTLSQNSTDLDLKINQDQLIKCGFRAWPKPNSKLMLLSGQVIVAFHPTLVTPSDRAFRAHCEFEDFKQETEIGLENLIQTHEMILGNFELPEITMRVLSAGEESLRKNETNQEMRVLKVGDPIIFEWKLEEEHGIFGIQIERCSAETEEVGKGMKILENGCSLDEELISDTTSSSDFSKIYANSLAFKFPEEHVVYVRCAVRTCVKRSEHLEIINGNEEDLCSSENQCGIFEASGKSRNRRQLGNNTRTDIIYVNGRFRIKKHGGFENLRKSEKSTSSESRICMPDVVYYACFGTVLLGYLVTISTTVIYKLRGVI